MDACDARQPKRKQDEIIAIDSRVIKNSKVVPSILKGVSAPRKPRVGNDFQAVLPIPLQNTPKTQQRSDKPAAADRRRPSSAATTTTDDEQSTS
jgi:hypothetical protein